MTGPHMPVGALLHTTGKATFKVIESIVQEQIRRAVRDFSTGSPLEFIFVQKDVRSFDSIHLPVYEFIPQDSLQASLDFIAGMADVLGPSAAMTVPVSKL